MNEETGNADELLEFLGAAWDGRLDEETFARLEATLDDKEARETLVAFSRMQVELAWLATTSQAHEKALKLLAPHFAESASRSAAPVKLAAAGRVSENIADRAISRSGRQVSRRRLLTIAAGILAPLAAVGLYSLGTIGRSDKAVQQVPLVRSPLRVARLASAADAVWSGDASFAAGDLLAQGVQLQLLQGTAQISMSSGADILLQSPCSVELCAGNRVRLERGTLTAQAADWAKGFVVETADLRVTDLGTRFAVIAETPGMSEAHVLEGAVLAEPLHARAGNEARPLRLKVGQAVRWNGATGRLDAIAVDYSRFIATLPEFRPLYPIDMANSGRRLPQGSRDSRWRISAGHFSGGPLPALAVVGRPAVSYLDNAPSQSQWISVLGGMSRGVAPNTSYTFETSFVLTKVDPATVHLVGQFLVDNRCQEIRLNGKRVEVAPWELFTAADFQKFHVVEIREGFASGVNRLEIDVINGATIDGTSHNPMALRVEWQAFGCAEGG